MLGLGLIFLCVLPTAPTYVSVGTRLPGDVVLGGLFPVHEKSDVAGQPCSEKLYNRGLQRMEAMLFAVDRINNDSSLLKDITIGVNIQDTCSRDTFALNQSLEFIRSSLNSLGMASQYECEKGEKPQYKYKAIGPVLGVIGGSYSSVSLQVANLLRLFRIPQISPASTAKALSDKSRFELFARTVPPDTFQALALVDIVGLFNWTYVSTIASEGSYGESGIEVFQAEAAKRNICIAVHEKVPSNADTAKFEEIITNLLVKRSAKAVVLFTRADDARGLLGAAKALGREKDFYWLASDGWGKQHQVIEGLEEAAAGAITVELESKLIPEFDEYMFNLRPEHSARNPWFKHYWQILAGCLQRNESEGTIETSEVICSQFDSIRSSQNYEQDSKVQFVIDAVYAFAYALENMKKDLCPHYKGVCPEMRSIDGGRFYKEYLLKVNFTDIANSTVQFDEKGDGLARYTIYNYQRKNGGSGYDYKVIGKWFLDLEMKAEDVMWGSDISQFGREFLPLSRCSEPCGPGAVKKMTEGDTCCWVCNTCMEYEYMVDEFTCQDCGKGRWPFENKTSCYDIEVEYMSLMSVFALVPICLASLGIVLTLFTILVLLKHKDTPIVRASGRELSYILLSGILLCYLNTFFLISKPGLVVCTLQRFCVGTGFSVVYGALLTKTNRIFRIFQSAAQSAARPSMISPYSQVFITLSLVSVQFCATVIWCIVHHPGVLYDYPQRDKVILKCNINDSSFVISQVYNMLLISTCTVYAIKTRKVPENFNEAKFIGFTMYTTCIIWLAFVALYFGTGNSYQIQITTLCVSISLSGYVSLFCLYSPKLYIILLHPEKNVRRLTMNTGNYRKGNLAAAMPLIGQNFPTQAGGYGFQPKPEQKAEKGGSLKLEPPERKRSFKKVNSVAFCTDDKGNKVKTDVVENPLETANKKDSASGPAEKESDERRSGEQSNGPFGNLGKENGVQLAPATPATPATTNLVRRTINTGTVNTAFSAESTPTLARAKNPILEQYRSIQDESEGTQSNTSLTETEFLQSDSANISVPSSGKQSPLSGKQSPVGENPQPCIRSDRGPQQGLSEENVDFDSERNLKDYIVSNFGQFCENLNKEVSKSVEDVRENGELSSENSGAPDNQASDQIVTLINSKYETVPLGLNQDIPDVFL